MTVSIPGCDLRHKGFRVRAALALLGVFAMMPAGASDVFEMSLDDLLKADVTIASRKSQQLRDVAAAVAVVSRDDIERAGATTIPDALRLVPGLQVAQTANGRWSVSARGFTGRFANKLQVLMDGRSLYSPLWAGVMWEAEDTLIEDIERIEVIRGPGAAMWGANAVNGVINIVTRKARDTVGRELVARVGSDGHDLSFRHGAATAGGHYRVWGKGLTREDSPAAGGGDAHDRRGNGRVGFRGDWQTGVASQLTVSGALHENQMDDRYIDFDLASPSGLSQSDKRQSNNGGHLLARHDAVLADGSEMSIQTYLDQSHTKVAGFIEERRTTFEFDFQHRVRLGERHDVVWGLAHRSSRDRIVMQPSPNFSISPERSIYRLSSVFVQDEITLVPNRLKLEAGMRLEHNSATRFELQPNLRAMWTPSDRHTLWAAAARTSRVPSRGERDTTITLGLAPGPTLLINAPQPGRELGSERVDAFDAGWRWMVSERATLDLAVFRNHYRDLRAAHLGAQDLSTLPFGYVTQQVIPDNAVTARSHGLELSAELQLAPWWRLRPSFSTQRIDASGSADQLHAGLVETLEGNTPRRQGALHSSMNLDGQRHLDIVLRHVGRLKRTYAPGSAVDAYTVLDVRYAWRPSKELELAVGGRNLGQRRHLEFISDHRPTATVEVPASLYARAKWNF